MTADDNSNISDRTPGDGDRVAKVLARAGVASRREVERLIEAGRVTLNGRVLDTPAIKVAPGDSLTVDGKPVAGAEAARVWRYHKPVGLVTTHSDPKGRPTVFDALPKSLPRVISVGRLDLNSEGLLLLTNDGELARALELPETGLRRRYRARARGHATQAKLDQLLDGVTIDGVRYAGIEARLDKARTATGEDGAQLSANLWITVTLSEGKNREVRKVLEALGLTVNRLIRQAYGPFQLGDIPIGAVEEVGPRVIREQLAQWIAPDKLPQGNATPAPTHDGRPPNGGRRSSSASRDAVTPEAQPAKIYKTGWARPKIKPRPAAKADPKSRKPKGPRK